jgi:hypothetical protein
MRKALCLCLAALVAVLASCGSSQEQAVRHLVIAELIQREGVPETRVQIVEVRFDGDQRATVQARILDPSRGGEPHKILTCAVENKNGRWAIVKVSELPGR